MTRPDAKWRRYLRIFGPNVSDDVQDEIAFHIESKTRELIARGASPEAARREAMRRFGDASQITAACRDIGGREVRKAEASRRLAEWASDARDAWRSLRSAPGFALGVILTLAAGMGGATGIFSFVDSWVLRALRFPQSHELIYARGLVIREGRETGVSFADYTDLAARSKQFRSLGAWTHEHYTLTSGAQPERVAGVRVTPNFLSTLGVSPLHGRAFVADEAEYGRHRSVIVSHGFWRSRMNASPVAAGASLELNGERYDVVGVLPEDFHFPSLGRVNVLTPLAPSPVDRQRRGARDLELAGRLAQGATINSAREDLQRVAADLAHEHPATNKDMGVLTLSLARETGRHTGDDIIWAVFGVALGLLLIACSNAANLLLVRAMARQRVSAIQLALGAGRPRLVRRALFESLILFAAAGVLGAAGGHRATSALVDLLPFENRGFLPNYGEVPFLWSVYAFAAAIAVVTSLVFGLGPALESASANVGSVLKASASAVSAGRRPGRLRLALVVTQVGIAAVVLTSTAVLVNNFGAKLLEPLGFEAANVLTFRISPHGQEYANESRRRALHDSVIATVSAMAPVSHAAAARNIPFGHQFSYTAFRVPDQEPRSPEPRALFNAVSPGYFETMRIPLRSGRFLTDADSHSAVLTAVIDEAFAARHFGGIDPIGRTVLVGRLNNRPARIAGVVAHVHMNQGTSRSAPEIYIPLAQAPVAAAVYAVRSSASASTLLPEIRRRVAAIDATLPVHEVKTMDELWYEEYVPYRTVSGMLVWFGIMALLLAAGGVYGVVSFTMSQRTRELGIRAALGASRTKIGALVLRHGLRILAFGLAPGLAAGYAVSVALRGVFDGISTAHIAAALAVAAASLTAAIGLATLVPARRAAAVDPLLAIRTE